MIPSKVVTQVEGTDGRNTSKALKSILNMNSVIEFAAPAHSLLLKQGMGGEKHQIHKNKVVSSQASPPSSSEKTFHVI